MLKELLEKRFTAKWWSDKLVEQEKLDYVLDCILQCPSKNGKYDFDLFILGNSKKSYEIKQWLYWENTYCLDEIRAKKGPIGNRRYNGQVLSPIVLIWVAKNNERDAVKDCLVSSSIAMIAAEEQNLNTGFNGCLGEIHTAEKLGVKGHAIIALGLGYIDKIDDKLRRDVYKDSVLHGFDFGNVRKDIIGPNRVRNKNHIIHHI